MPKIILGFVGQIASGKDVSKKYLEEKYSASSYRYSTVLRDILKRLYLPVDRNNMQNLSLDLRTRFGGDLLARVIIEDVAGDQNEIVIVDGVRRLEDVTSLTKKFPDLYIISIDASPEIRYNRVIKRNENIGDRDKTFEQFIQDGQAEAEREITTVMAAAQYRLDNNGTLEELYRQLDQIITAIKK
ncbi:MAG: AAA family ATPase [Patescibacteria group bacterium]